MNKRRLYSNFLRYSGILYGLREFSSNRILRILMYHRVKDREENFSYYLGGVPTKAFDKQMEFLARNFHVMPLEEAVNHIKAGKTLPKNAVSITVDDGYRDCYVNIYPVLQKYGFSATIFLTTQNMNSSEPFWVDKVGYLFKKGTPISPVFEHSRFSGIEVGSPKKKFISLEYVIQRLKDISEEEKNEIIDDLKDFFQVTDDELYVDYNLTWSEVREMSNNGILFGAHTVTHPILTRIPLEVAEREVKESKDRIESETGKPVYGFCYPNGTALDFNDKIIEILKKYGFKYAVTTIWGSNNHYSDLFKLKRLAPNFDDDLTKFEFLIAGGAELLNRFHKVISINKEP